MEIEEIEVTVRQLDEDTAARVPALFALLRRFMLVSIGAVAMTGDEIEQFIKQLTARQQLAQQDGERLLRAFVGYRQPADLGALRVDQFVESRVDQLLALLNIPSKRDIDDLSAKIALLTARVEELASKSVTQA